MFDSGSPWYFLFEHPLVGVLVFVAVSCGVIILLSGGKLGSSLGGLFRLFLTIFTTPFVFLRNALTIVQTSQQAEQDYAQSRVFMLFRLSRIQYMVLLIFCLLTLSGGITTSVLSLYPQAEIEQSRALSEQIRQLETEVAAASEAAAAASAPDAVAALEARKTEALNSYQQQVQSNAQFVQRTTFSGPIISQLASAGSAATVSQLRDAVDYYMASCPRGYNWTGMTAESCAQYRAFAIELANRKANEFNLAQAANVAEAAWRDADFVAQIANQNLANLQAQLDGAKTLRSQVSLFNPNVLMSRVQTSLMMLLATLWSVIVIVWIGAVAIEVFNWVIHMMRAQEHQHTESLAQAREERERRLALESRTPDSAR